MSFDIQKAIDWLSDTWKVWLIFTIVALVGYFLWWYLFQQRYYRAVDGKAQVRHGRLGRWVDLEEHLKEHNIDVNN